MRLSDRLLYRIIYSPVIIFSKVLAICFSILIANEGLGQEPCSTPTLTVYGNPDSNERGKSIVANSLKDGVYVAGFKDDSVLLFEAELNGKIRWAKTLDIFSGRQDHASSIIMDNDKMLVVAGLSGDQSSGGTIFCFRYNPDNHTVLWAQEYFTANRNYSFSIIQDPQSGNILLVNNPHSTGGNDCEILQLNKSTGNIIPGRSNNYHYGGSDQLTDIVYYDNYLYGTGRFTQGVSVANMRHTLAKMDPFNGHIEWIKMGHISAQSEARLYGWDLLVQNDFIYSIYSGDPDGTSAIQNKLFLQKTDLNGNLKWLYQYELPGNSDDGFEMISSASGIIILAGTKFPGEKIVLFKVDLDGEIVWSKDFEFSLFNSVSIDRGAAQLIEINDQLVFTAVGFTPNGSTDLIMVKTDGEGNMSPGCITSSDIDVTLNIINNPVFITINPQEFTVNPPKRPRSVAPFTTQLLNNASCVIEDTLVTYIQAEICSGQSYFGYTTAGNYTDHYITATGCDSVRNLELTLSPELSSEEIVTICLGDTLNGLYASGTYSDTLTSVEGCDSVATIVLVVEPQELFLDIEICSGSAFGNYSEPGFYTDTLSGGTAGCDTIRYLNLSVLPDIIDSLSITLCSGESYNGHSLPGMYIDSFVTRSGCDSIVRVNLSNSITGHSFITAALCEYPEYKFPGTFTDTFSTIHGCDSTRTITLTGATKYIPNVFTPNGDGVNDQIEVFVFPNNSYTLEYFAIFDRFGDMAYETRQWPIRWDGSHNGKPFMPGVFTYVLKYQCGNDYFIEHGNITLVR